jgi:hypothetical protein
VFRKLEAVNKPTYNAVKFLFEQANKIRTMRESMDSEVITSFYDLGEAAGISNDNVDSAIDHILEYTEGLDLLYYLNEDKLSNKEAEKHIKDFLLLKKKRITTENILPSYKEFPRI